MSAALVTTIILVFTGIILWQESKQVARNAEVSTINTTVMLAEHIGGIFDTGNTLLQAVEYQYNADKRLGPLGAQRFSDYLMRALEWSHDFDNIGFIDAQGIYRLGKDSESPLDLSDRDYFKKLRDRSAGSGSGPMIFSEPIFTRLSQQWSLVLARRVELSDGSFGGVIFLRWDIDRLYALFVSVKTNPHDALLLRTMDMAQVSRYPKADNTELGPGNREVSQALLERVKASPTRGFYRAVSPLDQIERYYAYLKVGNYPFYVIAGQATNVALLNWSASDLILLMLSSLMIVIVLVGAWHMNRLTQRRIRVELNNFAQRVLFASPVAMFLLNQHGMVMKANPAAEKLFGYDQDEFVGVYAERLQSASTFPDSHQRLQDNEVTATLVREVSYKRKNGSLFTALRGISELPDALGHTHYFLETVVDITVLKRTQEQLRELAELDDLTGLLNRRSGDIVLNQAILEAANRNVPFSVMMGDIDHFKRVNDVFGHPVGDRILVSVSNFLRTAVRNGDHCVRWGGEEFVILLPGCSLSVASALAARMCKEIAELKDPEVGSITISFGVAEWISLESSEALISRVDQALYEAKHAGRNCVIAAQTD